MPTMRTTGQRVKDVVRRIIQQYGTADLKRRLWDAEFSGQRWANLENTPGDFLYPVLEKHAVGGSILDLGCGSGNTGCELAEDAYDRYTGIDISAEAILLARSRTRAQRRSRKNTYVQGDVWTFQSSSRYDVILLRDSIYYIPPNRVGKMLKRYSGYLTDRGVFIVRMYDSSAKYLPFIEAIEKSFEITERQFDRNSDATVVVFRPLGSGESAPHVESARSGTKGGKN